ncbi:hypothetical protein K461DRAFT_274018 [Myriangium duriaei CBS 260.36]|uniref:DUF2470 domain-containing protein n=1 Tax=Myriangium duriaei CBS 260.36 TaxID=1168546 RepID=A0A9P4JEZ6_9PEZI|nr:hypothetical protein K461DRAFT_274018 [Myriangium duriaei CBS 260.36]
MADPVKDAAAKARIISHMNADHHDSVVRYLENYHHLSHWTATSGHITDITLSTLTIASSSGSHSIPFDPPMSSFRDARERLVVMDKECVAALGRSDITVREWVVPRGVFLALFIIVSTTFIAFSLRSNFAPSGIFAPFLPSFFRRFCHAIQPVVFYGMLAIHASEAVYMARGRLRKHNVNVRSAVYWQWVGDAFIEGFGAFFKFDELVRRKRVEKERQKH